jgi:hypothetical protein
MRLRQKGRDCLVQEFAALMAGLDQREHCTT